MGSVMSTGTEMVESGAKVNAPKRRRRHVAEAECGVRYPKLENAALKTLLGAIGVALRQCRKALNAEQARIRENAMARYYSKAFALAFVILAGMHFLIPAFAEITEDEFRAMQRAAQDAWYKLPPAERWCLEQILRQQSDSLNSMVLRGMLPDDLRIATLRDKCREK